jgi:hypothetical protein
MEKAFNIGAGDRAAFSHSGRYMASIHRSAVVVWDLIERKAVRKIGGLKYHCYVAFSPDDRLLVVKNTLGNVGVADLQRGEYLAIQKNKTDREGSNPLFITNKYIFDANGNGSLYLRDAEGKILKTQTAFRGAMIRDLDYHPETGLLVFNETLPLGHPERGGAYLRFAQQTFLAERMERMPHDFRHIDIIHIFADGTMVAVASYSKLFIVDVKSRTIIKEFEMKPWMVGIAGYHHAGILMALSREHQMLEIRLSDFQTTTYPLDMPSTDFVYNSLSISPDDRFLALGASKQSCVYLTGREAAGYTVPPATIVGEATPTAAPAKPAKRDKHAVEKTAIIDGLVQQAVATVEEFAQEHVEEHLYFLALEYYYDGDAADIGLRIGTQTERLSLVGPGGSNEGVREETGEFRTIEPLLTPDSEQRLVTLLNKIVGKDEESGKDMEALAEITESATAALRQVEWSAHARVTDDFMLVAPSSYD